MYPTLHMRQLSLLFFIICINILTMAQTTRPAGTVLTDETCEILCKAAQEKSRQMGLDISFAIADADGMPRLFRRFGDALPLSVTLVPAKAYTSAVTRTPTGDLGTYVADGGDLMGMNTCDRRITMVPGGIPLTVGSDVVGAIGVGGGSKEQDLEIAAHVMAVFNSLQHPSIAE